MQEIGKVIPNNMERYMAFMTSDLVFIDSFMSSSLSNLANNLSKYLHRWFWPIRREVSTEK